MAAEDENVPTRPKDDMMLSEKIALLWRTADSRRTPETVDQQPDEDKVPPRYQEVRSFLLDSPAYQWLLKNIRSSTSLTERKGTSLEAVTNTIDSLLSSMRGPNLRQITEFQATFNMDWDLLGFLRGQEYDTTLEIAVERAITVTGSSSNAQALSCMGYMCQGWPSSGREVLSGLQTAVASPNLSCSSYLPDGTEVDFNFRSSNAVIVARGGQAALTELCEQLAWLGATLRPASPSATLCLSTPRVTASEDAGSRSTTPSITVHIEFTVGPPLGHVPSAEVNGNCWHAMFRNTVVVSGFPILARHENEQGLEIPLDMMSILAEAHFATQYDGTLILKGPCTMLVPTRRTEQSVTWHFIFNEDGKRIPYYAFRERCPSWIGTDKVSVNLMEAGNFRNFVGWASNITRHLGTEEMEYDKIDWAGAKKCSAGLAVEQKLTISVSKIVGVGGSVVRGSRDKPEHVKQSSYQVQIKNARNLYVVLYDVATRRGWLVDGASALLHLVRTQVVRVPYGGSGSIFNNLSFNRSTFNHPLIDGGPNAAADILMDDGNMKHAILREFVSYADETVAATRLKAVSMLGEFSSDEANNTLENKTPNIVEMRKEIYKTTCLKELVSHAWSTLEQIYDRQIEVATTHTAKQLQAPFKTTLEGYEFMGIVSARRNLTRRVISLQSNGAAWVNLVRRIHAIPLFGQNFGDIYKPIANAGQQVCKIWMTVPPGHEYLAAPISLLKEIKQNSREEGKIDASSPEIAEGLLWTPSRDVFNTCGPRCKHMIPNRVQQLRSSLLGDLLSKIGRGKKNTRNGDAFEKIQGALIFGHSSVLDAKKLQVSSPLEAQTQDSFYDSGIGSSVQASFQDSSATASSSSMTPNLHRATSSTRASPSLLDETEGKSIGGDDIQAGDATCEMQHPSSNSWPGHQESHVGERERPADDDAVSKSNSSQPVTAPGVTNASAEDISAVRQIPGRRRIFGSLGRMLVEAKFSLRKKGGK